MKTKQAQTDRQTAVAVLLFVLYLFAVLKILLIRSPAMLAGSGAHSVNLIPFHTILYYTGVALRSGSTGLRQAFANIAGNVILFLPFGYFVPIFIRPLRRGIRITLVTAVFSTLVEVLQYVLHVGSSDVDDVLLNTLGGFAGFALLQLISSRKPLTRAVYSKILYLSAFLLCSGSVFAATQYGAQLGFSSLMAAAQSSTLEIGAQGRSAAVEISKTAAIRGDRLLDRLQAGTFRENQTDLT